MSPPGSNNISRRSQGNTGEALRDLAGVGTSVDTSSTAYTAGQLTVDAIGALFCGGAGLAGRAGGSAGRLKFLLKLDPCKALWLMRQMAETAAGRQELLLIGRLAAQMSLAASSPWEASQLNSIA